MTAVKKTTQGSTRNKRELRAGRPTKGRKSTKRNALQRPTEGPPTGIGDGNGTTTK